MNLKNALTAAVIYAAAIGGLWAQASPYVTLDIAWNNAVSLRRRCVGSGQVRYPVRTCQH